MKTIRLFLLLCIAVISGTLNAQSQKELGQLMRERNEYYFTLKVNDPAEIQTINGICSVDGTDGRTVVCYANQQQYDKLLQAGYQPNLQTPPSLREEAKMWEGGDRATYEWNSYLTYEQYVSMMEGFPSSVTNGASCTLLDLGTLSTTNHRRILGVRLNNGQPNGKPKFLYSSTMHGDEVTGMILMLRLIDEFCTSSDSRILNILNNVDLFIFPCTNPDGTYYGGNSSVSGARRNNGNDVDLNRHFPDFDDGAHPDGASYYQDETQWMMDLAQQYLFTMGANYHGGAEVVNYPWDTYQPLHPDDAWWQYVSREYARLCQSVNSNYMCSDLNNHANPSGITNGYAWYTITGSRQDYMNYYGQCREVTVECSNDKTPSASTLPNYWNYNHNAMLAYIEQCLNGIHGVVKDANTNETIEGATITVKNHDALGSSVTSHAVGDFHRPIKGGTWTLEVSKSGYHTKKVEVTVADDQSKNITVYLTPYSVNEMEYYKQVMPTAADDYVMGYLNGSSLVMPTHNSSSTVTTTSLDVVATDNGFSVGAGTAVPKVTLTAYQNGQYYISYNGRYLARSSYGSSLTWGSSSSQNGRWYINNNGVYVTSGNSTNYYLYYNNGSFQLSTTQQNNINFYVPGFHFTTAGDWSNTDNWLGNALPGTDDAVTIHANCTLDQDATVALLTVEDGDTLTIQSGKTLNVTGTLTNNAAAENLVIEDGGQLVTSNAVLGTVQKSIDAYTSNDNGWNFIASPVTTSLTAANVSGLIPSGNTIYDFYYLEEASSKWRNYKPNNEHSGFDVEHNKGYLYANDEGTTINFSGTLQPYIAAGVTINLANEGDGWNLVGNPFTYNAYVDKSYYVINGRNVEPTTGGAIAPCTGIVVKATGDSETVTFTKNNPAANSNQGNLNIVVAEQVTTRDGASTGSMVDKAIVSFNEGSQLEKFVFNEGNAKLYIPQGQEEYAIATSEAHGEKPVNFRANENGQYTITVSPENVEMNYLHLIDNMTGSDVDLLVTPNYTFTAKTSDYASRFRLVFSVFGDEDGDNENAPFAYFHNGEIVIHADVCNASLQVVDVMGRVVVSCQGDAINRVSTKGMVPGVYVLRLLDGDGVKTQKIVIQ